MEEEAIIYNWILVYKADRKYIGWSKAAKMPECGEPDGLEWIEWGKELPPEYTESGEAISYTYNPETKALEIK